MISSKNGPHPNDEGFTLVEVLLALVVLGTAVVVFVSGLAAVIQESDLHRKDATIHTIVRDEAEALQAAAASCSGALAPAFTAPAGYTVSTTTLTCPTTGSPTSVDIGVRSADGRANQSLKLTIIVRKP